MSEWIRPTSEAAARAGMLEAEKYGEFQDAALYAVACAEYASIAGEASLERRAQVYATLHLAKVQQVDWGEAVGPS